MKHLFKLKSGGSTSQKKKITAARLEEIRVRLSKMNHNETERLINSTGVRLTVKQKQIFINGSNK
jgi:hypothetical protein